MHVSIIGSGTWGVALSIVLSDAGHDVLVWSAFESEVQSLTETRTHVNLPGSVIPGSVHFTSNTAEAVSNADILLMVVPSPFMRETAEKMAPHLQPGQIIACATKGLEKDTLLTMTEVIGQVVGPDHPLVALSGPTHAEEVAIGMPTLIVSAGEDMRAAALIQNLFLGTCVRPYTATDIKGVELCGALKNIIALACGIATGLGLGDNTRAAIMTRGIFEIARVGRAMGCEERTFAGLAGIGDLIVTATSMHSRNNRAGILIGQGVSPEEAIRRIGMVVEGINAIPAALRLAEEHSVEIPIISAVNAILTGQIDPKQVVSHLLNRSLKAEDPSLRFEKDLLR